VIGFAALFATPGCFINNPDTALINAQGSTLPRIIRVSALRLVLRSWLNYTVRIPSIRFCHNDGQRLRICLDVMKTSRQNPFKGPSALSATPIDTNGTDAAFITAQYTIVPLPINVRICFFVTHFRFRSSSLC
jgi:hypothetical protein